MIGMIVIYLTLDGFMDDLLKENELKEMSLIYADFTGTYNKEIKPLEYLQDNNDKIRTGTVLGFTWSNKSKIMIQFILF